MLFAVAATFAAKAEYKIFYDEKDVEVFNDYCAEFESKRDLPMGELIVETGKYFLDAPYVNYTLEAREPEELIVNLRELDCVTFVETSIALAQTVKSDSASFELYCDNLRNLRYRQGELRDFTSRLHYFSDWIYDKQQMGIVEDYTHWLGGDVYPVHPKVMSRYPKRYRQLVNNPEFIPVMDTIEDAMSTRKMYSVPRDKASKVADKLENGMVIGTTTPGVMDVTHVGFLCFVDGKPHFMHASSLEKKVVITEGTLEEYLKSVKSMTGFMAAKVVDDSFRPRANVPESDKEEGVM